MPQQVRRGYQKEDEKEFVKNGPLLIRAQEELCFLLDRGYEIEKAITFIGNHYMLSSRQRMALTRASASSNDIILRKKKQYQGSLKGKTVLIDGFNLIITLETAFSYSTLFHCMDSTIRDLCGLHGTYRLIDKTELALAAIQKELQKRNAEKVIFYLDAPISNSGRLKKQILSTICSKQFEIQVELVNHADAMLWEKEFVVTSDAIILNRCISWINLAYDIIVEFLPNYPFVELSNQK